MKTTILSLLLLISGCLMAKQVKFSVDMTGQIVSVNGVHIIGDFQQLAGLGPDLDPSTAVLTKEGTTEIYSIIVNIPAFRKYEYRFVNGDQTYESEFVPEESRVGYNFVDNRWIYIDSIANDITQIGAVLFGGNAPAGKRLLRFRVDMSLQPVAATGVHLATSFDSPAFSPVANRLYSFQNNVYEIITYVSAITNTYSYSYLNGNTSIAAESFTGTCISNNRRTVTASKDSILNTVCFSSCAACVGVGIAENTSTRSDLRVFPNPANHMIEVTSDIENGVVTVADVSGKILISKKAVSGVSSIDVSALTPGLYLITLSDNSGSSVTRRLAID